MSSEHYFCRLENYSSPATSYPRKKRSDGISIVTHTWPKGQMFHGAHAPDPITGTPVDFFVPKKNITTVELRIDGKAWMVDDPVHWFTIQKLAATYHGHVLCAGLGLGLIVHALSKNKKVKSITVVNTIIEQRKEMANAFDQFYTQTEKERQEKKGAPEKAGCDAEVDQPRTRKTKKSKAGKS